MLITQEKLKIYELKEKGHNLSKIAKELILNKSTISMFLLRNPVIPNVDIYEVVKNLLKHLPAISLCLMLNYPCRRKTYEKNRCVRCQEI